MTLEISEEKKQDIKKRIKQALKKDKGHTEKLKSN